jgi:hypothetical protein
MSRRGRKPIENQAVTWEDKKLGDWQKTVFRWADDGTMRHALPPVDTSWSRWPWPGFASGPREMVVAMTLRDSLADHRVEDV